MVHVCLDSNVMSILPLVISVSNKKLKMIRSEPILYEIDSQKTIFSIWLSITDDTLSTYFTKKAVLK